MLPPAFLFSQKNGSEEPFFDRFSPGEAVGAAAPENGFEM